MPKMIQIRNVPDQLHRRLKARAAEAGMSLSDYLLRQMRDIAELPTMAEWMERVSRLTPVAGGESAADTIRAIRDASDRNPPKKGETVAEAIRAIRGE